MDTLALSFLSCARASAAVLSAARNGWPLPVRELDTLVVQARYSACPPLARLAGRALAAAGLDAPPTSPHAAFGCRLSRAQYQIVARLWNGERLHAADVPLHTLTALEAKGVLTIAATTNRLTLNLPGRH